MFKHQGNSRTLKHNLRLAVVLSFVAGLVNLTGLFSIGILTTNVTGHFAFFIQNISQLEFFHSLNFFLYISSFLMGSFLASLIMEYYRNNGKLNVYVVPIVLEALLLIIVVLLAKKINVDHSLLISCLLLLSMGLQNSFVTKISNAVVRTTHLTGLITDLGIELAQLLFETDHRKKTELCSTISLRLSIICFFFIGGIIAAFSFFYIKKGLMCLLLAVVILIISLFYDDLWFRAKEKVTINVKLK